MGCARVEREQHGESNVWTKGAVYVLRVFGDFGERNSQISTFSGEIQRRMNEQNGILQLGEFQFANFELLKVSFL